MLLLLALLPAAAEGGGCLRPAARVSDPWPPAAYPDLFAPDGWSEWFTTADGIELATRSIGERLGVRARALVAPDSRRLLEAATDYARLPAVGEEVSIREAEWVAAGLDPLRGTGFDDVYVLTEFPPSIPISPRQEVLRVWTLPDAGGPGHHRSVFARLPRTAYADYLAESGPRRARGPGYLRPLRRLLAKPPILYEMLHAGGLELRPRAEGGSEVVYRSLRYPGGNLTPPKVRRFQRRAVPALVRGLVAEAERRAREGLGVAPRPPDCP